MTAENDRESFWHKFGPVVAGAIVGLLASVIASLILANSQDNTADKQADSQEYAADRQAYSQEQIALHGLRQATYTDYFRVRREFHQSSLRLRRQWLAFSSEIGESGTDGERLVLRQLKNKLRNHSIATWDAPEVSTILGELSTGQSERLGLAVATMANNFYALADTTSALRLVASDELKPLVAQIRDTAQALTGAVFSGNQERYSELNHDFASEYDEAIEQANDDIS